MPKHVKIGSNGNKALLAGVLVSALAMAQWCCITGGSAAEPAAIGSPIMLAQNPPPCGHDPQHPCPKGQQPPPKQAPQPPHPAQVQPPQPPHPAQAQPPQPQPPHPAQAQPPQPPHQQPAQAQPPQPPQGQQPPGRIQPAQGQPPQPQQQPVQNFQNGRPPQGAAPGQPAQNAPGQPGGPRFGNVQELNAQRHEQVDASGHTVIEEPDHRQIMRQDGQAFIRHDEAARFLQFGQAHVEQHGNETFSIVVRADGFQIVTVTDPEGRLIRRFRRGPDGREIVLIDNRPPPGGVVFLNLAPPLITIPQDQYIVDTGLAQEPLIYAALEAPPLVPIERPYSLDEIRYNVALRDRMRRIDVDTINFDTGSWEVTPDQVGQLSLIAEAVKRIVSRNPNEVFLIEGHTDAVGNDVDNLSLSDRRAETIADILTTSFQIPPENLTTQGYGAQFLKIPTPDANRQNRRVTVRRITPLLLGRNG